MNDAPQVVETVAQQTAVIQLSVPQGEIRKVMGPAREELMVAVAAQGIETDGPWFTHHFRMDPDTFDFEIGVPVARTVAASGRVKSGELPAATVARATHRGGYEGHGAAWGEFEAWISAEGLAAGPDLWEPYVAGPESSPEPDNWRTELNRPLNGPA